MVFGDRARGNNIEDYTKMIKDVVLEYSIGRVEQYMRETSLMIYDKDLVLLHGPTESDIKVIGT